MVKEGEMPTYNVGKGGKGVLIALDHADMESNRKTLEGLVQAIKLDINEDVKIVTCTDQNIALNDILYAEDYKTIILIGLSPDRVGFGLQASPYFYYKMERFQLLLSDSLTVMNAEKAKKMAFWTKLQERFLS